MPAGCPRHLGNPVAALPLWWGLSHLGPRGYGLGTAAVILLALWAAGLAQEYLGRQTIPPSSLMRWWGC